MLYSPKMELSGAMHHTCNREYGGGMARIDDKAASCPAKQVTGKNARFTPTCHCELSSHENKPMQMQRILGFIEKVGAIPRTSSQ